MITLANQSLPAASGLVESLQELPYGVHGIVAGVAVAGFVLWFHGRTLVKPMTVGLFALTGAWVGFFAISSWGFDDTVHPYAGAAVFAAVAAALGFALYRFSIAIGFGVVLGIVAPLCASVVIGPVEASDQGPLEPEQQLLEGVPLEDPEADPDALLPDGPVGDEIRDRMREGIEKILGAPDSPEDPNAPAADETHQGDQPAEDRDSSPGAGGDLDDAAKEALETAAARARAFLEALWAELRIGWDQLPGVRRMTLASAAALGAALGIVLGWLMPKRAAGAVTAMVGAAVWLPALVWLTQAFSVGFLTDAARGRSALEWLIIWGLASLVGMTIQWAGISKKQGKRKAAKSDD